MTLRLAPQAGANYAHSGQLPKPWARMLERLLGMMSADLAVDLGTASTQIAAPGEGVLLDEPSVVAIEPGARRILSGCAVGHVARQMLGRTPESISVVRPMAAGVVADDLLCEGMLRYFLKKVGRSGWKVKPRVMMTAPGAMTAVERRALYQSALRAGVRQVLLIPEATAAAVGAGLPVLEPLASMVCNVGGGTTEVAVLSLGDVVSRQSVRTAGDAMDQAVVDYFRRRYCLKIGLSTAEELKIDLGSAYPLAQETSAEVRGVDAVSGVPRRATATSEEIREALAEPLSAVAGAVLAAVDGCSPDLASDLVDHGLVLCGGGALLRGLDRYLSERTGLPCRVCPNPQSAVALGSSQCLEHLDRWRGKLQSSDHDL